MDKDTNTSPNEHVTGQGSDANASVLPAQAVQEVLGEELSPDDLERIAGGIHIVHVNASTIL